jgi:hypothetical protein
MSLQLRITIETPWILRLFSEYLDIVARPRIIVEPIEISVGNGDLTFNFSCEETHTAWRVGAVIDNVIVKTVR